VSGVSHLQQRARAGEFVGQEVDDGGAARAEQRRLGAVSAHFDGGRRDEEPGGGRTEAAREPPRAYGLRLRAERREGDPRHAASLSASRSASIWSRAVSISASTGSGYIVARLA